MTAPFECEVRFHIDDVGAFQAHLRSLGARVIQEYAFSDHYCRPPGRAWDPHERALRIREHLRPAQPAELLLTWTETRRADGLAFKRSRLPEGKACLYRGTADACRLIARGLECEPWLVVRKDAGVRYTIPDLGELVIEQVAGVGWMGEVEVAGSDPDAAAQAIRRWLDALGVSADAVVADPVAAIVAGRTPRGRRVYFSGSIRGGRSLQRLYASIVSCLQQRGYQVLTAHVAAPDVLVQEQRAGAGPAEIYERDMRWLRECDLVVAEVSVPSLGVGVEIAAAAELGKPIVCLCRADVALSAMIEGNRALRVVRYRDEAELLSRLESELRDRGPEHTLWG